MTNKPVKLPEAGQWPDKVAPLALLAGIVLSTLGFLMAFLYAGPVNGAAVDGVELIGGQMVANKLLLSQKIFYFHMPVALVSFCSLAFACYYSVRFLATKKPALRHVREGVHGDLARVRSSAPWITGRVCGSASSGACGGRGSRA